MQRPVPAVPQARRGDPARRYPRARPGICPRPGSLAPAGPVGPLAGRALAHRTIPVGHRVHVGERVHVGKRVHVGERVPVGRRVQLRIGVQVAYLDAVHDGGDGIG